MGNLLSWLGTAATDVGDWYGQNQGWVSPALSLAGTMYAQNQQQDAAKKAQRQNQAIAMQNQQLWQQTAFPRPEAMNAAATENRGQLGQARLGSYQNLANQLAARGFGSGSGLGYRGGADIERGYGQAYGNMLTGLTKFANTPTSGLPAQGYYQQGQQPQQSPQGAAANWFTGYMDQSRGYNDIIKLIQKMYGNTGQGQGQGQLQRLGNPEYY